MLLTLAVISGVTAYCLRSNKTVRLILDELSDDGSSSRELQIRKIQGEAFSTSRAEEHALTNVKISTVAAGFAAGAVAFPILQIPAIGAVLYLAKDIFIDAYRAVIIERTTRINVVHSIVILGVLGSGFVLSASLAVWLVMATRWVIARTEDHSQDKLINLLGSAPEEVYIRAEDNLEIKIPFDDLKVGDVLAVSAGELIPIDGLVVDGQAMVDQQRLTGESQPVEKYCGERVFSSTLVVSGKAYVKVEREGTDTVAAKICAALETTSDYRDSIRRDSQKFVDGLTLPMLAAGAVSLPVTGLNTTLGIMWNVPGLRMEIMGPLAMFNFLRIASADGILFKDGRSLQTLSRINTVVFDKTGTLTLEELRVSRVHAGGLLNDNEILGYAAAVEYRQEHPIAKAILNEADQRKLCVPEGDESQIEMGLGLSRNVAGKLAGVGSAKYLAAQNVRIPDTLAEIEQNAHADGHSFVYVTLDGAVMGAIELESVPRPEAEQAIELLKAKGLSVTIISGDHEGPTRQLAESLGIENYHAQTMPEDKATLIRSLQKDGRAVCFVGDGINDSIALKQADLSISLAGATTVALDTAQIVLMDGDLKKLNRVFELGHEYEKNQHSNFLISTVPSSAVVACAFLFHWSFVTSMIAGQAGLIAGLYNVMRPLAVLDRNTEATDKVDSKSASQTPLDTTSALPK